MRVKGTTIQQWILGAALLAALCWNLAQAAEIKGLQVTSGDTGTRAELRLDSTVPYRTLTLDNPDRFVVDLPGTAPARDLKLPASVGVVKAVRSGRPSPDTTRIVFDLGGATRTPKPRVEQGPDGVRLVIEWPAGAVASPTTATTAKPSATTTATPPAGKPATSTVTTPGQVAQAPAVGSVQTGGVSVGAVPTTSRPTAPQTTASQTTPAQTSASPAMPQTPAVGAVTSTQTLRSSPLPGVAQTGAPGPGVSAVKSAASAPSTAVPTSTSGSATGPSKTAASTTAPTTATPTNPAAAPKLANAEPAVLPPGKTLQGLREGSRPLIIAIDAGHGGQDPGAHGPSGKREKDVTLAIARELARQINATPGLKAYLTRDTDVYLPLTRRTQLARSAKADMFVSIHADAAENRAAKGSSVFVLSLRGASSQRARWLADKENAADLIGGGRLPKSDNTLASVLLDLTQSGQMRASEDAASHVLDGLKGIGNVHKREIERANFAVLRTSDMPAMLVETAFISNPDEEQRLIDPDYQRSLARAVLRGIDTYFTRQPPPGTLYAARARAAELRTASTADGGSQRTTGGSP